MADRLPLQSPGRESDPGALLTDAEVGKIKGPSGLFAFSPRVERLTVVAAVVFQLAFLVTMILGRTVPYIGAETVLLHVEPVDPRDLSRGDYVTLGYAFSRTPAGKYQPAQLVYVTLVPEKDGRHYHVGQFLDEPPTSGIFIRGTAQGYGRATYGIESYYVQENKGHDYEKAVGERRLWAEVAIDKGGNPAIRGLVVE